MKQSKPRAVALLLLVSLIGSASRIANNILAKILSSPRSKDVSSLLALADQQATAALNIYQTMDYANSAYHAKDAYSKVLAAAQQINVPVGQQASPADYKAHGANYMFTDDFTRGRH